MKLIVEKSRLKGAVRIPASKSHTIRAVAIGALANGRSTIGNPLVSSDTLAAVDCYRALGAGIDTSEPTLWKVDGTGGKVAVPEKIIDVGNSGTTLRVALGSAALVAAGQEVTFTGDEQIRSRPIGPLAKALSELGARCVCLGDDGKAPVRVAGQLAGGKVSIACKTSQYLSSLLLCAPLAAGDSEIDVTLLNEPGYVQMTLDWLDRQGIVYEHEQMRRFKVAGGQGYRAFDAVIPADFSSATFFLCAASLFADEVSLLGMDFSDSQPDKAVVEYLRMMGADICVYGDVVVVRGGRLRGVEIDMNSTPDALPAMAVTAAFAEGRTGLVNVAQARNKETDRIGCMAEELRKIGISVEELADGLIIEGGCPRAAELKGRSDHRIVMALSLAGLGLEGQCSIDTAEAMSVTFPNYVELMKSIGANMELSESANRRIEF